MTMKKTGIICAISALGISGAIAARKRSDKDGSAISGFAKKLHIGGSH